jgi:hypothetical protein
VAPSSGLSAVVSLSPRTEIANRLSVIHPAIKRFRETQERKAFRQFVLI